MGPEDEAQFLSFVFERPTAWLIPQVRNPTPEVPRTRDPRLATSLNCHLWDSAISPEPHADYMPKCNDYYLRFDKPIIQFYRSEVRGQAIAAGRIAWKPPEYQDEVTRATKVWFDQLARRLKQAYSNSFVHASDYQPAVGYRERDVWVGPDALALYRNGWKLTRDYQAGARDGQSPFWLHYFDPAQEQAVVSRYRKMAQLLGEGRVVEVGEVKSRLMRKRVYRLAFQEGLPFTEFEGPFSCLSGAEPQVGDAVACVFAENVTGRRAEPWEPDEIRKVTAKSRERVITQLKKSCRF